MTLRNRKVVIAHYISAGMIWRYFRIFFCKIHKCSTRTKEIFDRYAFEEFLLELNSDAKCFSPKLNCLRPKVCANCKNALREFLIALQPNFSDELVWGWYSSNMITSHEKQKNQKNLLVFFFFVNRSRSTKSKQTDESSVCKLNSGQKLRKTKSGNLHLQQGAIAICTRIISYCIWQPRVQFRSVFSVVGNINNSSGNSHQTSSAETKE